MTRLSKCWNHQYFLYCRRKTRRNKPYGNKGQASQVQQETSHGASSYGFRNGFTSAHQKAEIKAQTKPGRMTLLREEWYLITMQGGLPWDKPLCMRSCFTSVTETQGSTCPEHSTAEYPAHHRCLCGTEGPQHCSWGDGEQEHTTAMEGSSSAMLILHGGC